MHNESTQSHNPMEPWEVLDSVELDAYHSSPMPNDLDRAIGALVQRFALVKENERETVRAGLKRSHYDVLSIFSERAATLAVRENSLDRLRSGIAAVAIGAGSKYADPRDTGGFLFIFGDAGRRIASDVTAELSAAGQLAGSGRGLFELYRREGTIRRMFGGLVLRLGIGLERVEGKGKEFRYYRGPKLTPDAVRAREAVRKLQADARKAGKGD